MAQPYVGEIRMFAGNFAPAGWFFCEGQILPISEFETLFQLIGTTYGGDGESTFGIPDLRGRIPLHQGNGYIVAQTGGAENVTLNSTQIPAHNHAILTANSSILYPNPSNNVLGQSTAEIYRETLDNPVVMNSNTLGSSGGSQPHSNMMPYLCISFIISLFGIFPSPT